MTVEFGVVTGIMAEIQELMATSPKHGADAAADYLVQDMAAAVCGSNKKARKGVGLDETIALCVAIFEVKPPAEYSDR